MTCVCVCVCRLQKSCVGVPDTMLYWLYDLRYRAIASEKLYDLYVTVRDKMAWTKSHRGVSNSSMESEYEQLHLRMSIFEPNLRQRKREEHMEELGVTCNQCSRWMRWGQLLPSCDDV